MNQSKAKYITTYNHKQRRKSNRNHRKISQRLSKIGSKQNKYKIDQNKQRVNNLKNDRSAQKRTINDILNISHSINNTQKGRDNDDNDEYKMEIDNDHNQSSIYKNSTYRNNRGRKIENPTNIMNGIGTMKKKLSLNKKEMKQKQIAENKKKYEILKQQIKQEKHRVNRKGKKIKDKITAISWNVDGWLNAEYGKTEIITSDILQYKPSIILTQETAGLKGGYKKDKTNLIAKIGGYKIRAVDEYGITAIYLKEDIANYSVIKLPSDLFGKNKTKQQKLHITALILFTKQPIRDRHELVFVNGYRSPADDAIDIKQIHKVFDYIKRFMGDRNPNIMVNGDFNFWSELIGSDPTMRTKYKSKFEIGDDMFDVMAKHHFININDGNPTLWKKNKETNTITEYAVDSIWINHELMNHLKITTAFQHDIRSSDHYPNYIEIDNIGYRKKQSIPRYEWNIKQMTESKWLDFKNTVNNRSQTLLSSFKERMENKHENEEYGDIIHATMDALHTILTQTGREIIGRTKIYDINRPYLTEEIMDIIRKRKAEKKKFRNVLNRIRNLRRTRTEKLTKEDIKKDIKDIFGTKHYDRFINWPQRDKEKTRSIRRARRRWQNKRTKTLGNSIKNENWYTALKRIEDVNYNRNTEIGMATSSNQKLLLKSPISIETS